MDDFDWNDIDFGVDETFDYGSLLNDIDWNSLDFGVDENFDIGSLLGNFAEDAETQGGGFYGNIFGRAEYDPRTDTTTLYDPTTDTERLIKHSTRTEDIGLMPDFDESEFTRIFDQPAEQGDVVITGPKTQEDYEDDLSSDFWRRLINPTSDIGTIEITGTRPTDILTDEEHTRVFDQDQTPILTDEEHTRVFDDTTEEDLKDKFWQNLTNQNKKNIIEKLTDAVGGKGNAALLAALLGGLGGLLSNRRGTSGPVGYQGGIPKYTAVRGPARSPTEGGRRPGGPGIGSLTGGVTYAPTGQMITIPGATQTAAAGGLMGLAGGDRPARYLAGGTDGMADKIQTDIDGKQPARLSHGEFVIPADVVSHLGNGNSDAGANVLYDMMAKVRKARTGTEKQGRQINPNKFVPGKGR